MLECNPEALLPYFIEIRAESGVAQNNRESGGSERTSQGPS